MGKANVLEEDRVQRRARELIHRVRHTSSSSLDGDIVVLLKVDTRLLLGWVTDLAVQLLLHAGVTRTCDVLAVLPDTEAGRLTLASAAAATTSTAVATTTTAAVATGAGAAIAPVAAATSTAPAVGTDGRFAGKGAAISSTGGRRATAWFAPAASVSAR
jgi:hypothetical protein